MQLPMMLAQTTKYLSVSMPLPGPTMQSHHPGLLIGRCIVAGHVGIPREGVQDQHRVLPVRGQAAVGCVGDGNRPEPGATFELHRVRRRREGEVLLCDDADGNLLPVVFDVFAHR